MDEAQQCGRCKIVKPTGEFSPSYRGKVGTWCRACFAAYNRGERGPSVEHAVRVCDYCGVEYHPKQLKRAAKYCSRDCKIKAIDAERAAALLAAKSVIRVCQQCGTVLAPTMRAHARYCSSACYGRWREARRTPQERRARMLLSKYKITPEQYVAMLAAQGGCCAICGSLEPNAKYDVWAVDHCHSSGLVRGLLCGPCNTGLGQFGDDPVRLERAAIYVRKDEPVELAAGVRSAGDSG